MTMKKHRIAVIAGDGIGTEVIAEGEKILKRAARLDGTFGFSFTHFPWGCEYYLKTGRMMPEDGLKTLSKFDAIFLGAVGFPGVPDHISLRELLLEIRHGFDEYVNMRPVKLLPGAPCPLVGVKPEDVDMTFIRENSEGEYAGSGAWLYKDTPEEVVIQNGVFSRKGTERIIRYAYELARKEKKTLTSISKGNALNYSMVFWDQIFKEVGADYPDVKTYSLLVDAGRLESLRRHPHRPRRSDLGRDGPCGRREPQPGTHVPVDVRADPRQRARHCGEGSGESACDHLERGADAGVLRTQKVVGQSARRDREDAAGEVVADAGHGRKSDDL